MPNDVSEKRDKKAEGSANIVIPFEGENFAGILVDRDRESGGGGAGGRRTCLPSTRHRVSEWQKGAMNAAAVLSRPGNETTPKRTTSTTREQLKLRPKKVLGDKMNCTLRFGNQFSESSPSTPWL